MDVVTYAAALAAAKKYIDEHAGTKVIKLTNSTETLAQLKARIDAINTAGEHVFFDTSSLGYPLYLCTIAINYQNTTPESYRLNDLVSGNISMGKYDASKTIATILSEAVNAFYTLTVTCTTHDGVTVTGQTVTIRKDSATGVVYATLPYNGQPVSVSVPNGFQYYVSVTDTLSEHFNPSKASGIVHDADVAVTLTYKDVSSITTLEDLKTAIDTNPDLTVLIGHQITIPWTDLATNTTYQVPCDIVDFRTANDTDYPIVDENGVAHNGVRIQWHYGTPFDVQFDAAEQVAATEATAVDGLYYYGRSGNNYTKLQLTAGDTIPYSDYDAVYKNELNDNEECLSIKFGYNRYRDSAWRQFLCSDDGVGQWWAATHIGDVAPSQLNSLAGFLAGFSAADLALMKKSKITCYTNSVTDGNVIDTMYDKWYLPSGIEMYGTVNENEGAFFPHWKEATGLASPSDGNNAGRIAYRLNNHTTSMWQWTRSAIRDWSHAVWYVNHEGGISITSTNPSNATGALPVCAIY